MGAMGLVGVLRIDCLRLARRTSHSKRDRRFSKPEQTDCLRPDKNRDSENPEDACLQRKEFATTRAPSVLFHNND